MNHKFHMQYDQNPRLQNSKILSDREIKIAADLKITRPIKSAFSTERYICLKVCMGYYLDLDVE